MLFKRCSLIPRNGYSVPGFSGGGGGILCRERATKENETPQPFSVFGEDDPAPNEKQTMQESWTQQMVPVESVLHIYDSFIQHNATVHRTLIRLCNSSTNNVFVLSYER